MTETKVQSPIEDFDWAAYENGETAGSKSREELVNTYDESLKTAKDNEVVTGVVKSISKREVRVDIGMKSDAIIPVSEFRYNPDLKVGDEVEVFIETLEDKNGQLRLSHKKACQTRSWDRVNQALENDEIIKGYVKSRTKGGMIVDVFGIEAFLPGSQIDVRPIRDYDVFVDKTMEFKVVKINQEYKNVVVSHKALIEAELEAQKREIISKLEKGQVLEGKVKNITPYGVFVDSAVLTVSYTSPTSLGAVYLIPAKLLSSTRISKSLSLTSTMRRNASLSVLSSFFPIPGMLLTRLSKWATTSRAV